MFKIGDQMANDKGKKPEITVLMPAYNEEGAIGNTVRKVKEFYPDFEVLVVDDGSTDNTVQEAMDAGANVWPHPYNMGNGAAIKSGLRTAQGEWVIMMDADGQHAPEDIAKLLEYKDKYDMVVGARTKDSQTSLHRDIANKVYNWFSSYVTNFNIKDLTSGFRLVRKDVAQQFIYLLPNTFSYPTTLTMAYLRSGFAVKYVPIKTKYRVGKSKIKIFKDGSRFLLIIIKISVLFSPLRVFLPVSFVLWGLGIAHYVYTFVKFETFTNMSALMLTTSVVMFMMGLVSEQISQMNYDKTK